MLVFQKKIEILFWLASMLSITYSNIPTAAKKTLELFFHTIDKGRLILTMKSFISPPNFTS